MNSTRTARAAAQADLDLNPEKNRTNGSKTEDSRDDRE